ncbi:AzlC family ABC transporter permease [Ciceribacter sp. L1K23]|uniref:AzlC family ABC transporter permease n=1 Tax=Ciceribacter sp. L1K23 TaxID=2820276 RepID=UPI001B819519|nr:AzlC family ABC transporter permease [Ciceribacter sp. L1K23]MBR0555120.1 AzlC family ABC transporter permease [Ciceribacter sp. L1K23]
MRADLVEGLRQAPPVLMSTIPFALLFGAVAVGNGLTVAEATLMSATLFAGASQLVGIELFGHNVPAWLIVLSVFAVNFRHILYSAAVGPFLSRFTFPQQAASFFLLTDPQFALALARDESGKKVTFAWYMGFGLALYVAWVGTTAIGAYFGRLIGNMETWGIDVLLPVYFMGLLLGFRKRDNFALVAAASALSSVLAHIYVGSPWHVSIGAAVGIVVAAALPPKAPEASE